MGATERALLTLSGGVAIERFGNHEGFDSTENELVQQVSVILLWSIQDIYVAMHE